MTPAASAGGDAPRLSCWDDICIDVALLQLSNGYFTKLCYF
jgi:hypothetical protein